MNGSCRSEMHGVWAAFVLGTPMSLLAAEQPMALQSAVQSPTNEPAAKPRGADKADEPNGRVERWWDMNHVMCGWDGAKEALSAKGLTLNIGYRHIW